MATQLLDAFDYGPVGMSGSTLEAVMQQAGWTITFGGNIFALVSGISTGTALHIMPNFNNHTTISRSLTGNITEVIFGIRCIRSSSGNDGEIIAFFDGTTQQFYVYMDTSGRLALVANGVTLATSTASVHVNSEVYVEGDVVLGTSAAYTIYLNGKSILNGTGRTTSTANNYVNGVGFNEVGGSGSTQEMIVRDLYVFDTTGTVNKAVLLTSPKVRSDTPTSDSQTQWTNQGNILVPISIATPGIYSITSNTNAPGANTLFLLRCQADVAANLNGVSCLPEATSVGANFKSVLYTDSAGSPNSLVATGAQVTGTTSGTVLRSAFSVGQALVAGTYYWVGFITDTSVVLSETDSTTNLGQKASNTYSGGAPATAPVMTTAQPTWLMWGDCTGATTNWESLHLDPPSDLVDGDESSISSSTVSQLDLFVFPNLATSETLVYSTGIHANVKKSDTGARTVALVTKSGTLTSTGTVSSFSPGTTYGIIESYYDTDPATSSAWTRSGLDSATHGIEVAS